MPRLKFLRTPTEAESGPGNKYKEGETYDVNEKSFNRWMNIGCVEEIKNEEEIKPLLARPVEGEVDWITEHKEYTERYPNLIQKLKESEDREKEVESIESGGQAPPVIVQKKKFLRSAGRGLWNVYDEDGNKLLVNPLPRKDAEEYLK